VPVLTRGMQLKKYRYLSIYFPNEHLICDISPKMKKCDMHRNKNRCRRASLTAEAALVFPVFFFTVYLLWQLFILLLFQLSVGKELTGAAIKYSHLGYPERKAAEQNVDISWLYQPLLWNALPKAENVEDLWVMCLPEEEEGTIRVSVGYRFICEAPFFPRIPVAIRQNFRFYPYLGETEEDLLATEETKDIVYMTEHGTVYHESRACSYLNVVVRSVASEQIGQERNSFGHRYTLCERCDEEPPGEKVYYSAGGTKYHLIAGCSALKRTVTEKNREETKGVPACHKCGSRKADKEE